MIPFIKRHILFTLLVISYGFLSYNYFSGWWYSAVGTITIIILSYLIWNKDFLNLTGLKMKPLVILKSFVLTIILILATFFIMNHIANEKNVLIQYTNWKNYFHDIFYVLNEEIVIGAIPLLLMIKKWKLKPIVSSIALAFIFSVIHFVFYKWVFNDRGIIQITTLATLFFVGIIRNNLIIQTGHIGYSWALHFSWIVVMFGSSHQYISDNLRVPEPVRFNIYLGSYELLIISAILVGLSIIYLVKKVQWIV